MKHATIIDTGPLVAFFNRRDSYHEWTRAQMLHLDAPFLTCEAVLSETIFLLREATTAKAALIELLNSGTLKISFEMNNEVTAIKKLLTRYHDVPMSFADACLVRMSEKHNDSQIFTVDTDFQVYRKHGRQAIPLVIPR